MEKRINNNVRSCIITILLCSILVSGCVEEDAKKGTVAAPLNTLGLLEDDLEGQYEQSGDDYITQPYIMESGYFKAIRIAESYNTTFVNSSANFIKEGILRYDTKDICKSAFDVAKGQLRNDFYEISHLPVGDDSFFGQNTWNYYEYNITLYVFCFRIADVLVLLNGMASAPYVFRSYGVTIQDNILDHLA